MPNAVLSAAVLFLQAATAGVPANVPPDLAKAVADYDHAQIHRDGPALRRLLADDYVLVNGGGSTSDKAQFVTDSTKPGSTLEPFVVEDPTQRVWRDGAVMAGEVHLKGLDEGRPFQAHFRFADVWRKQSGKWQVVFTEVTRFPATPKS